MPKKICQHCNIEYEKDKRDSMRYFLEKRMFCSHHCASLASKGRIGKKWNAHQKARISGKNNPKWKGGKYKDVNGYIVVTLRKRYRKLEHRIVMEQYIGRKLRTDEHVHHINHDKTDNRIENLQLIDRSTHGREHAMQRWHDKAVGVI